MYDLLGKTALVTGAAKRLGKAISLGLAKQGVNIIIHYGRSREAAQSLQREILDLGVQSWIVSADFRDPSSCENAIRQARELSGKIDILVNNASIFTSSSVESINLDE